MKPKHNAKLQFDLSAEELKDTFQAVQDGIMTAEEAFDNMMLFQTTNRVT